MIAVPLGNSVGSLSGACLRSAFVIYQDPLAYLLGLEGIALLDAWAGEPRPAGQAV